MGCGVVLDRVGGGRECERERRREPGLGSKGSRLRVISRLRSLSLTRCISRFMSRSRSKPLEPSQTLSCSLRSTLSLPSFSLSLSLSLLLFVDRSMCCSTSGGKLESSTAGVAGVKGLWRRGYSLFVVSTHREILACVAR